MTSPALPATGPPAGPSALPETAPFQAPNLAKKGPSLGPLWHTQWEPIGPAGAKPLNFFRRNFFKPNQLS